MPHVVPNLLGVLVCHHGENKGAGAECLRVLSAGKELQYLLRVAYVEVLCGYCRRQSYDVAQTYQA